MVLNYLLEVMKGHVRHFLKIVSHFSVHSVLQVIRLLVISRPRILLSYSTLFSSPILSKGTTSANGNEEHIYCESSDQRGKS